MRTWSNSWSTSYRYHESRRLPCLLGCRGKPDCLSHYACCPLIHEHVSATFGQYLHPECLKRFGTTAQTSDALRQVACIYYAYHVVKFQPGICSKITTNISCECAHLPLENKAFSCENASFSLQRGEHTPPGPEPGADNITATAIVVNADVARSSFIGGLRAAAFTAGLKCPSRHSLPNSPSSFNALSVMRGDGP